VIPALVPLSTVALNFVFTPSKATLIVCAAPAPNPVRLIAVPLAALFALLASLIVCLSSTIM